ncbi:sugar ABC transporter permease [Spirochaetia bacterium]|nr:sugar ABC transporter permease [Spirochaetia bacterium]
MKKIIVFAALIISAASMVFASGGSQSRTTAPGTEAPLQISVYYSDNSTLPFRQDWLAIKQIEELYNVRITWEIIPMGDYDQKVSLALNTGDTPDVILYRNASTNPDAALALNGAITPISDYSQWTPEWNARVQEYGMKTEVDRLRLQDGKLYFLSGLTDKPFYDGGVLFRQDIIAKYGIQPDTWENVYQICKRYKADNPSSYPFTMYYGPRVQYRMTQPAWGISVGRNGPSGRVLSWDYAKNEFFAGAISEQYREYMRFWNRMYREGLLDPELAEVIPDATWYRKLSTGSAIATLGWYDQIGGIESASTVPGLKFNMYAPPAGPAGAYGEPKNRTGAGILFPIKTSRRADFERVVRTVDKMFFSPEAVKLWCLGVEGTTYNMVNGKVQFVPSIATSPDGPYKHMQITYGLGAATTQMVWINATEMTKYDQNYADINARVAAMGAILPRPPAPHFDDITAERVNSLMGILWDAQTVWDDQFLTGKKSLDTDWAAYVADMRAKGIDEYLQLYNRYK